MNSSNFVDLTQEEDVGNPIKRNAFHYFYYDNINSFKDELFQQIKISNSNWDDSKLIRNQVLKESISLNQVVNH